MFQPISLLLTGRKKISQKSVLNIYLLYLHFFPPYTTKPVIQYPAVLILLCHICWAKSWPVVCAVAVQCVAGTCVPAGCDHSLGSSTRLGKLVFSNLMLMFSSLWLPPEARVLITRPTSFSEVGTALFFRAFLLIASSQNGKRYEKKIIGQKQVEFPLTWIDR